MMRLLPGEPAPWFRAPVIDGNPKYTFDTAAGRPILLLFHGSAAWEASAQALQVVEAHRALFNDRDACFFGVSIDPADATERRIVQQLPGVRWFLDFDRAVSQAYGASDGKGEGEGEGEGEAAQYRPCWLVLDRALRVFAQFPVDQGTQAVAALKSVMSHNAEAAHAPVLIVPQIFQPALCHALIDAYRANGGTPSGFMRDVEGVTTHQFDSTHKRRSDFVVEDERLKQAIHARFQRLLVPQIKRAFQFDATRIERLLVACYDDQEGGGMFRPHRDNTTNGTAHRRFACTINLNAEAFEGGDLCFPEFGQRTYRAPTGGAVVFSCSLLHEARPVTKGERFAFLPFFYDEPAAALREANLVHVAPELQHYRSGLTPAIAGAKG